MQQRDEKLRTYVHGVSEYMKYMNRHRGRLASIGWQAKMALTYVHGVSKHTIHKNRPGGCFASV